ncbi:MULTISPECIES: hypothetical protein [unclassified Corallococcus]|uniref:hypothetical protein n=1 Tax=unclassified Corallococcus TaxID=2685029 RepID=UPI001A90355B|nr:MULTISPECIES: hypothetical protein [unclassified Corallococcus]MBN9686695.1 hypothetical protein [Corallococcus sp. NCSPR001]WAS81886.1 hypothetical protein O0N60_21390 [Corallococcus sp. NCRR]
MQLRKMMVMLAAVSSMTLALTACGDDATTVDSCTSDTDCSSGFCNTAAGVCMDTCESGSDCPDSEKNCAVLAGSSNTTQKVCQCQTNQLCNTGDSTDLVCGTVSKRCEEPGSTPSGCTKDADCGSGNTCNTTTGVCSPAATTCTGEGQATCAYGSYCGGNTCTPVPAPTCANFDPAQGGKQPVWNASSSTGPIIYSVTKVSFGADTFCGDPAVPGSTGNTAKARVKAYIPSSSSATFPSQKSGLPGLFYVRVNGSTVEGPSTILQSGYSTSNGGKSADFVMNFCPGSAATTLSIGLYFTGGNEICSQISK